MRTVALIPARAGSKRAPGKNMADLLGRPLVAWTIDAAIRSGCFGENDVYVSTDDRAVAVVAAMRCCQVIERRAELAGDDTPMLAVVHDALAIMHLAEADLLVLLQPTSPLRWAFDIFEAVRIAKTMQADSVVSVAAHAEGALFLTPNGRLRPAINGLRPLGRPVVSNGAVYVSTVQALMRGDDWYSGAAYGYLMPRIRSLDVDEPWELDVARYLLETKAADVVPQPQGVL